MKRCLSIVLALSIASASFAPMAMVARAAEPTPQELATARTKFQKALELEKANDWKGALALLREVAAIKTTAQVRFHIALCLERTGKLLAAREEYLRSKDEAETKEGPDGAAMQKKAEERIADLDARIPKLVIRLAEDVVTAKVSVDGGPPVSALVTPTLSLDPGEHEIVVTSPGRVPFKKKLVLTEKMPPLTLDVVLPLENDTQAPEPETDDAPKPKPKRVLTEPGGPSSPPWPWILGGFGVVSLGTAGVLYALRDSTIHDLDRACGANRDRCPRNMQATESRGRTYTTAANVFVGVGAVSVGAAIVWLVLRPDPAKKSGAVTVGTGPTPLGIGVTGSF